MKKYFEYTCLTLLSIFSFYYTNKVTNLLNDKDPVMIEIKKYDSLTKEPCTEGYIVKEGTILGSSGKTIDIPTSYTAMKGNTFNKDSLVYKEITCKINLDTTKDTYIIKGSESKNQISLLIKLNDLTYINDFITISKKNNITLSLIVNDNILNKHTNYIETLYKSGINILYNGTNIKNYINIINEGMCIELDNSNILPICSSLNLNTLKISSIYDKNIYTNIKNNLEKGSFYVISENKYTLKEINALIKYIKGKGLDIVSIYDLFT